MARKDEMEGLGVTFKIGPGQKLVKRGVDAPLKVEGGAAKPKVKPVPQPAGATTGAKPVESQSQMPRGSSVKPVESQKFMPRGPATPARPVSATPAPGGKPLFESFVAPGEETSTVRMIKINPEALTGGTKKDDGSFYGDPTAEDRPPLYKNGGKIRGDGKARLKTKGSMR